MNQANPAYQLQHIVNKKGLRLPTVSICPDKAGNNVLFNVLLAKPPQRITMDDKRELNQFTLTPGNARALANELLKLAEMMDPGGIGQTTNPQPYRNVSNDYIGSRRCHER